MINDRALLILCASGLIGGLVLSGCGKNPVVREACLEDAVCDSGEIRGHVVMMEDGRPVAAAEVRLHPGNRIALTDAEGAFFFQDLPVSERGSTYTVTVRHEGFLETTGSVTLSEEDSVVVISLPLETRRPPSDPADPEPDEQDPPRQAIDVRVDALNGVQPCVFKGDLLTFQVSVRNITTDTLRGMTLRDSLSPKSAFTRPLEQGDVVVDRERFPDATVIIHPGGFAFTVDLGSVATTDADENEGYIAAYAVSLPSAGSRGTWCNRVVARDDAGFVLGDDTGCATTTLALMLDVSNDDGELTPGGEFDPTKEVYEVGDGGSEAPGSFVYRIEITNENCATLRDSRVVAELDPAGIVAYEGAIQGYPSTGSISVTETRFVWEIGDLAHSESAILTIGASARSAGKTKSRIEYTSTSLPVGKIDEEPTQVMP